MSSIRTSLIITTYNQPDYLRFVLKTVATQIVLPDEVLIADDGSRDETGVVVREFCEKRDVSFPVIRAWQEDRGFRLNASRNNALALASGDYVIMIDGDCFLNPHFIADHLRFAARGRYVGGSRVNIREKLKRQLLAGQEPCVTFFTRGTSKKFHAIRSLVLARALSGLRPEKGEKLEESADPYWRSGIAGANLAFWRDDALAVNGFNEILERYGGDDLEFASRLEKTGVDRFHLVHYGMVYHFSHAQPYGGSIEGRLTPKSPAYLASLETPSRCKDEFGLTRALLKSREFERPEKGYRQYNF
ncbi:MAG: glycosyltransferase [Thermoguttaceae bacterium]|nr:glycosyltransferase [Thermoguttaceae bacterium]